MPGTRPLQCLAAVVIVVLAAVPAAAQQPRRFDMGFTAFPYDSTPVAAADTAAFIKGNADMVCVHLDSGVPWTEAARGRAYHPYLLADWAAKRAARPEKGKLFLALSPGRGDLAGYRGEKEGMPLPAKFRGKAFDDPAVVLAYLAYCREAVKFFRPDYLAIGIEVNEIRTNFGAERWKAYVALHKRVYRELKRDDPTLRVFASFSLHTFLTRPEKAREVSAAALDEIMPENDLIAVSFYPFMAGGTTDYAGAFATLTKTCDRYRKPYAIAETAEAAEPVKVPKSSLTVPGSPARQKAYFEQLLRFAGEKDVRFVTAFLVRDYDALWDKMKATVPEEFVVWKDCGLLDEKGNARPALAVWRAALKQPRAATK